MEFDTIDLVASLQALPESDPIEVDGVQFAQTCQSQCAVIATINVQTVCAIVATCV
jgi:hypothetical protein